jgi:hypothetical protein
MFQRAINSAAGSATRFASGATEGMSCTQVRAHLPDLDACHSKLLAAAWFQVRNRVSVSTHLSDNCLRITFYPPASRQRSSGHMASVADRFAGKFESISTLVFQS